MDWVESGCGLGWVVRSRVRMVRLSWSVLRCGGRCGVRDMVLEMAVAVVLWCVVLRWVELG